MEERLIDKEREIKIKRKREGDDAIDALAGDDGGEETPEEELLLELPEGEEYDEDLVGLTPTQLKEELERREKARMQAAEESKTLAAEGEEKLSQKAYEEAAALFAQAVLYDPDNVSAHKGLWRSRTEEFTKDDAFFDDDNAEDLAGSSDEVRSFVLEKVRERLSAVREELGREAAPLRESVRQKQTERREPLFANRKYYLIRFFGALLLCVLLAIGSGVSAGFLYSTRNSALPIALAASFGGLALVALVAFVLYARKLLVAHRLCRENERLSSTEDGARLEALERKLRQLNLALDGTDITETDEEEQ